MRELRRQSISVSLPPEATSSGAHRIVTIRASRVDRGANEQSFTERVQTAIKSIGGKSDGRTLDVSNERAIHTFFTELGAFDHLVFTAGDSLHLQDLASTDLKQAGRAFELRYWAALAAVKYGSPHIRKGALSSSLRGSPACGRKRDGSLPQVFVEPLKP